jgi:hypothetical protein
MPNQRDPNKKLVGAYVAPEVKAELGRLGVEEATALEMLVVESLIANRYLTVAGAVKLAERGSLRAGTVIYLRSKGILPEPKR